MSTTRISYLGAAKVIETRRHTEFQMTGLFLCPNPARLRRIFALQHCLDERDCFCGKDFSLSSAGMAKYVIECYFGFRMAARDVDEGNGTRERR